MTILMLILLISPIWILASIAWFFLRIANSSRKDKWYDYVIGFPILAWMWLTDFLAKLRR